jgi:hypothetical protein
VRLDKKIGRTRLSCHALVATFLLQIKEISPLLIGQKIGHRFALEKIGQ